MKKNYIVRFVLLMLCVSILACGCGKGKSERDPGKTEPSAQTTPVTKPEETTEPAAVYEKQTVYLCTMETRRLYESDAVFKFGYAYDEYGRKIESWRMEDDGTKSQVTEFVYDEFGNNTLEYYEQSSRYERTYDEAGRMLSQLYYYEDECSSEKYFTYNEDGYLTERTEITRYSEEKTYTYKVSYAPDYSSAVIDSYCNGEKIGYTEESYNADGQVTFYKNYDADGKWTSSCECSYDAQGRLVLEEKNFSRDTQADYDVIYTYDENGLLISKNVNYYYGHLNEYTYEPFEILVRVN